MASHGSPVSTKGKQQEMIEEEGEGYKGMNDEDINEEEEDCAFDLKKMRINPYDVDDHESNKKPSKVFNPVHDSIDKDFMDFLCEVLQVKDFKSSKHHWMPGGFKPLSKQIDEVIKIF